MELLPILSIDRNAPGTLTEQLVARMRDAILDGRLRPGDALPPSRRLAAALEVSRSVVVAAYEQLLGEAFLESTQGSGTRVAETLPVGLRATPTPPRRADPEPTAEISGPEFIDLRSGRPFVSQAPHRDWVRALSRVARAPWSSDSPDPRGEAPLRLLLASHTRLSRGIACSPDEVILTSGTSEALVIVALALRRLHAGRAPRIAVEDPGYPEGAASLAATGAELVPVSTDENGVRCADLRATHTRLPLDAIMLTPSHQFPLGGRLPASERLAILEWAREHGTVVIEDDYDSEFRHTGAALPAMASMSRHGETVFVASLNKILSPSLRCGMLILPHGSSALREALLDARTALGAGVPEFTQAALTEFLAGGGLGRAVARNRREYRHRRDLVLRAFAERGIRALGADGGLHVVVPLPRDLGEESLAVDLRAEGVLVERLGEFAMQGRPFEGIVIGYGAEPVPRLIAGIEAVCARILAART